MLILLVLFFYSFFLGMWIPLFFPTLHLLFFVPFLIYCFYRCSFIQCLWLALFCGIMVDLLSSQTRLGIYSSIYCLTAALLYNYKYHFFEDRLSTLPTLTGCFAILATIIQLGITSFMEYSYVLSWQWIQINFFLHPLQNAFLAYFGFSLPARFLFHYKKRISLMRLAKRRNS